MATGSRLIDNAADASPPIISSTDIADYCLSHTFASIFSAARSEMQVGSRSTGSDGTLNQIGAVSMR